MPILLSMIGSRRSKCGVVLAAWASLLLGAASAQSPRVSEYQVKAAFLYNFAKFVEWPAGHLATANPELQICVLGTNPFGDDLRAIAKDKTVDGRKLLVRDVADLQQARSCQILFVATPAGVEVKQLLQGLQGTAVLTVGDSEGFAEKGGMISFVLQNERVQFEVNYGQAKRSGLTISSRLLSVAKVVIE